MKNHFRVKPTAELKSCFFNYLKYSIFFQFKYKLTGEIHGDMTKLVVLEDTINILKQSGIVKNTLLTVTTPTNSKLPYQGTVIKNSFSRNSGRNQITPTKPHTVIKSVLLSENGFTLYFSLPNSISVKKKMTTLIIKHFDNLKYPSIQLIPPCQISEKQNNSNYKRETSVSVNSLFFNRKKQIQFKKYHDIEYSPKAKL